MKISLCAECYLNGHCRRLRSYAINVDEITHSLLPDIRHYARSLGIKSHHWADFLLDAYRDYPGVIVGRDGCEILLDTSVFDGPNIRTWFRDLLRPMRDGSRLRFQRPSRERYRVMASILRARDPVSTAFWDRDVANDNGTASDMAGASHTACRYKHFAADMPDKVLFYRGINS